MNKKPIFLILLLLIMVALCSCQKESDITRQGFYFDTVINITVDEKHLSSVSDAMDLCAEMENTFSPTKEGSEIYKINNNQNIGISKDVRTVLDFSMAVSKESDGAFDVTVAPLTKLWNVKERTIPPTDDEIASALSKVGYENFSLTGSSEDFDIDPGAVAKGYAADRVRDLFIEQGIDKAIIDLGGNVVLIGEYSVGIRDPFNPDNLYAKIMLKDKSAVTSGAYQRYFEYNGKRYHHIIDPRTGKCAESGLASVTVISESSMEADALSTAIYVMGEDGLSLCEKFPGTDALLITEKGDVITTKGFEEKYSLTLFN